MLFPGESDIHRSSATSICHSRGRKHAPDSDPGRESRGEGGLDHQQNLLDTVLAYRISYLGRQTVVRNLANLVGSVTRTGRAEEQTTESRSACIVCDLDLRDQDLYHAHRVCPRCRFHYSMSARERIESLADPNSFRETNRRLISLDPLSFASSQSYSSTLFSGPAQDRADRGGTHWDRRYRRNPGDADRPGLWFHGRDDGLRRR